MKIDQIRIQGKIKPIKPYKNKFKDVRVYGYDTETVNGKIYSLQIYGEDKNIFKIVYRWDEKRILDFIYQECNGSYLYAHNLSFDLGVSFGNMILDNENKKFFFNDYFCVMIYPHPCYAMFYKQKGKGLIFADTFPFFKMSLKKAGKFIKYEKVKMIRPTYLGERKPKKSEMDYFIKYAMLDAEICYKLALKIKSYHKEFDIPMRYSVSVASLSAKIFKKYFVKEKIATPQKKIITMALKSYHGGRTEAFAFGHSKNVTFYDINSSYPYSMSNIIIPLEDKWMKTKTPSYFGFFNIDCEIPKMKISPLPYDKNRLLQFPCGTFKDLTVTGMEALAIKEVATSFKVNYGYVYNGRSEKYMKDFVNHFYERKRNAKNPVDYMLNKTIQNSLYGKTIQLNTSRIEIGGYVCGQGFRKSIKVKNPAGMFNPVIASWITAISRLNLYHEMKRNEPYVLYCDTDSIATTRKCPQLEDSKDLGKFAKEKTGSHFYLVREKRYILKDKKILKSGRHAFRGSEELFNECLMNETDSYAVKRMIQLREAKIQQKQAFEMEFRNFVMTNEPSDKRTKPNLNFKNFKKKFYWLKPFFVFEKENIQEIVQKKTKARKYQISMIPITKTQIPYRELYVRNFFASTKKRS